MHIDFRGVDDGKAFDTDVCIIGAGAAGIALALELSTSGLDVLLAESGGLDPHADGAVLSEGETEGFAFTGLTEGRARALGGATRLWAGQCIRLEPIDFEPRSWAPRSGWPIAPAALDPFYDRAEAFVGLEAPIYDRRLWPSAGLADPGFDPAIVLPRFTAYCPEPDFKTLYGGRLEAATKIRVLLNATITKLHSNPAADHVDAAEIAAPGGPRGRINARTFVVCGGAIENARLLLASNDVSPGGLGNGRDLVGRFLQDHPTARTAQILTDEPALLQRQFAMLRRRGVKYWPKLALSPELQRREGLLDGVAYPQAEYGDDSPANLVKRLITDARGRRLAPKHDLMRLAAATPALAFQFAQWKLRGRAPVFRPNRLWVQAYTEQSADPDNRVSLSDALDPLGVPRAKVAWRIGELERRTLLRLTESVGHELRRLGFGTVAVEPFMLEGPDALAGVANDTFHHAGTTRMSTSAATGVVDTDCRVHGVDNLYVAGGSVMPASGYANPTLTIIALALRLGDHLRLASPC